MMTKGSEEKDYGKIMEDHRFKQSFNFCSTFLISQIFCLLFCFKIHFWIHHSGNFIFSLFYRHFKFISLHFIKSDWKQITLNEKFNESLTENFVEFRLKKHFSDRVSLFSFILRSYASYSLVSSLHTQNLQ